MKRLSTGFVLLLGASFAWVQSASGDNRKDNDRNRVEIVRARLAGYEEVPAISSPASGWFLARIEEKTERITYWLSYDGFETNVTQSHLHFGAHHTSGGINVWLCANPPAIANAPANTQPCPEREGEINGKITPENVVGPATPPGQGLLAAEFDELVAAIRAGAVYVNVHSATFGPGEIRGQLR